MENRNAANVWKNCQNDEKKETNVALKINGNDRFGHVSLESISFESRFAAKLEKLSAQFLYETSMKSLKFRINKYSQIGSFCDVEEEKNFRARQA